MEVVGMEELKSVSCDPKCGFEIKSHDEKEIVSIVKNHAKNSHKMSINDNDVRKMMKSA